MIRHLTSHLAVTPAPGAGKAIQAQLHGGMGWLGGGFYVWEGASMLQPMSVAHFTLTERVPRAEARMAARWE